MNVDNHGHSPTGARRATTGLEPYAGPWTLRQAEHLLRRGTFGATRDDIAAFAALTPSAAVRKLFEPQTPPPDPYGYGLSDPSNPQSARRIYAWSEYAPAIDNYFRTGLRTWWLGLMLAGRTSLLEKMTFFWHNHFVSEFSTVLNTKYMHMQNMTFRTHAFGNFRTLVRALTVDPAMLVYLNGNSNRKGSPNENYARELQELFTIGKGKEIAAGNYTHYTEDDVREAARVLTGWRDNRTTYSSYFDSTRHDSGNKTFSAAYQNTVITGRTGNDGANELNELIDMILRQPETARAICRKLYRWFVYYEIDATVEQTIIEPLAAQLRTGNYEIQPVLETLLSSAHFHADDTVGAIISSPVNFLTQTLVRTRFALPEPGTSDASKLTALNARSQITTTMAALQMDVFDAPSVAGWPAYHQSPQFHELWINTVTLPLRGAATDLLVDGKTKSSIVIDCIAFARESAADPSDPRILIDDLARALFAIDITTKQREFLLENVLLGPGLPDYEWTVEWLDHVNDPTNALKKEAVNGKLKTLLKFMLRMAEYHLS